MWRLCSNIAWQFGSGYNQRSRIVAHPFVDYKQSTAGQGIGRCKGVIGEKLKARNLENQKTEVRISISVLNKMTKLGRPESTPSAAVLTDPAAQFRRLKFGAAFTTKSICFVHVSSLL
ncbi:MAG: hypothetical protein ACI92Z_001547 [Paracoccaceae bacterium]|jgi:hypothetical protein